MLQMAVFTYDGPFPSYFANDLAKVLSLQTAQLKLVQTDATHVEIPASAGQGAAIAAIAGLWRWMESTVGPVAHPGGAAGNYSIFLTAKNNNISSSPNPFTDDTDYTFAMEILAPGATPTIVAGTVDVYVQVGIAIWSGTAITRITQTYPTVGNHSATHATGGADAMAPADIGAVPVADPTTAQPGDLIMSAANSRVGCVLCDGTAYPRTGSTAALFAAIGTKYGNGDGSTTFNVPDFRGRTILGAGAGAGLTTRDRGATGGEETHHLTSGESGLPSHNHTDSGHFHAYTSTSAGTETTAFTSGFNNFTQTGAVLENTSTVAANIQPNAAADAASAHNNMQPFGVANVFIKT